MAKRNITPFKFMSNPAKSPLKASREFNRALEEFKGLSTEVDAPRTAQLGRMAKAKDQRFDDFYKDISNPYANMNMENFAEDLTVNQQQAEFEKQQAMQSEANIMQGMQGAAGGSGIAGLAQAMANQGAQRAQRASASIGQQEAANQQARVRGAQDVQRRREMQAGGQLQAQQLRAGGATAAQQARAQSGMQQAQMANQWSMQQAQLNQQGEQMKYQAASDARNLQFQKAQSMVSLIAGQDAAAAANAQANKSWAKRTFSDRKLKKNIVFVKKSPSGLNIYNFEYKDSKIGQGVYQGVMSDEIPKEAVVKNPNGYDMVDYNKIDVDFIKINK